MTDDHEVLGKAYDARLMRRLLGYLRPHTQAVVVALGAIVGYSVLQLAHAFEQATGFWKTRPDIVHRRQEDT